MTDWPQLYATQVPRIHALSWTKIRSTEDLPVIAFKSSAERQAQVAELRQTALKFLETLLFGDKTAAQYVLLQLVSRSLSYHRPIKTSLITMTSSMSSKGAVIFDQISWLRMLGTDERRFP